MACAFCQELLTRWKLLLIFEQDAREVSDARRAVDEHRRACKACQDEHVRHSRDCDSGRPWMGETDWLVQVVMTSEDDPDLDETLDFVGRLFAFALSTDTRMLAQLGGPDDPDEGTYELWFSFKSDGHKQRFLQMVRDDGYVDPDDEFCL